MALAQPKNIRLQIRKQIIKSKFPLGTRKSTEQIIVRAVRYFRVERRHLSTLAIPNPTLKPRISKRWPDESSLRYWLIAELFRVWTKAFGAYPSINNKDYRPTPFVRFCEPILQREGVGKILDHLEEFRSYRIPVMKESGFTVARGKVL